MKTKSIQLLLFIAATLMTLVGHPDTAQAQNTVSFSPNPVILSASVLNPAIQSTTVSVAVNGIPATSVTGVATMGFLSASAGATPGTLTVIANPQGLQAGTYNGQILVTVNGTIGANLPVTLTVYNANTLTVDQTALTFNASVGGTAPASQTVNVNGNVPGLPVTVTTAATNGANFLSATPTSQTVPTQIIVTANPAGLAAGTYTGTITVASANVQPQVINVTLNVSGQPILVVNPNPLNLIYQTGINATAPTATLQILSTIMPVSYSGAVNYLSCGQNWFTVTSGLSGVTNSQLQLTVNLAVVGANTQCTGNIVITSPATSNSPITVGVNLQTSALPLLNVSPSFASFNYSIGGAIPAPQIFSVASSGNTPLNFSVASASNFLMVPAPPPNGTPTPGTFAISLNPSVLPTLNPGTYPGTVTVTALGSGNSPVTIPVTLTVSNNPLITLSSSFLNFNYQTGNAIPPGLSVNLSSTMGSLPFTVSVPTTTGSTQFVQAFPLSGNASTTPTPLTINLVPSVIANLAPGIYQNQVQISGGVNPQLLTVNLTVSNSPLVNINPQQLTFNFAQNGTQPASQSLTLSSTNGGNLPVSFSSNQSFILVGPSNINTPGTVNVTVVPTGLTPGTYTGQITVFSGTQTQVVPVTLTVTSGIGIATNPTSLAFTQTAGGAAPVAQQVSVSLTGASAGMTLPFSVGTSTVTGGGWLLVNGGNPTTTGTAPGAFTVTANGANLAPGTYNGAVTITAVGASNSSVTIPVTLTVMPQALSVTPTALTFSAAVQGSIPSSQTIAVTSGSVTNLSFTATAQSTPANWLAVTPASGTTPQNVTVSVNQAGLSAGTYMGTVTLTVTGSAPITIPVTLTVGTQSAPVVARVVNAASGAIGAVAPGELISLFGTGIGPVTPSQLTLTPQGTVATSLGNVQVMFDGIAAPLTYVSATQINAVVPYEVFGRSTTNLVVTFNGISTTAMQLTVAATAPGIFALNGAGSGPAAALNQDNTINSASTPAAKGSIVTVYATGGGQITPSGVTGSVTSGATSLLNAVNVTVGGVPATLAYAGSAPGLVSGVLQLNITIPASAPSGAAVPVIVTTTGSGATSQTNATIAIQ